ncbi:Crp/Fnr family transcriptional regulator [Rhodobacteraceae bacterium N5(2021)]|uniref:Crp/Fnr family transcriptional regulator n=1 Tax=Gymnodinialimonas phycosphaerae TaxID=2841589 RepID=A0A975YEJ3_9RHOB|nr:Crp/Fnr family transcriptional regulator [Gymnodinialimonas phycosphaerae]MBY4893722.1 Crp/Fnr family transcriptional regulator [Gymnodinialimonas phycosphaerae]
MNDRPISFRVGTDCADCPIRHKAVCAHCDADELVRLEQIKTYRTYSAGEVIVWAGDEMDFVASLVSGVATLTQTMEDGRRQMVGLLLASDFIGRPNRSSVSYDVTATTDVTLCCFRRKPFQEVITNTPHVSQRLLEMTLDELDAAREWMLILGRKTAREKIASFLAILARRNAGASDLGPGIDIQFELPLTREAMSEYLGLTLETVSRQMSGLKRDGVILLEGKRRIVVPDFDALLNETGDDADGGMLA